MLVLTRKYGERLLIGDNVVLTVCTIGKDSVRIGIEAPREIEIVREELAPGRKEDDESRAGIPARRQACLTAEERL